MLDLLWRSLHSKHLLLKKAAEILQPWQVDVIEGSRIYMPAIYVINKIDQITLEELNVISKLPHYCPVCAYLEWNLDGLVDLIWEYLDLIRVYTKPKVRSCHFIADRVDQQSYGIASELNSIPLWFELSQ